MGFGPPQGSDGSGIPSTIVDAKGDIISATAADTISRLAVGANGTVLTAASGQATGLEWATPAAGGGTLDQGYDQGGAGAGRTITVDAGAVTLTGSGATAGTFSIGGTHTIASGASAVWDDVLFDQDVSLSGTTNVTTATGFNMVAFNGPTITDAGTITSIALASTVYIGGAPTGSGITLTSAYALWVDAGNTRLDGSLLFGATDWTVGNTSTIMYIGAGGGSTAHRINFDNSTGASVAGFGQIRNIALAKTSGSWTSFSWTCAAMSGFTASTEVPTVYWDLAHTVQWATGALTTQREVVFLAPTYGFVGASTISDAATVAITASPSAGTNATITRSMALWVQAGTARFDGGVAIGEAAANPETGSTNTLRIANGTAPDNGIADVVQFYSSDNSAGNTVPSFYCEGTEVLATGQADSVSSVRVKMRINGTVVTLLAI